MIITHVKKLKIIRPKHSKIFAGTKKNPQLKNSHSWIFGYISIKEDLNTVKGVVFDHVGETAGLGAEITQDWFKERFVDEKLFDSKYNLMGITVSKTNNDPSNLDKSDHEVDFISGATITCDGVTDMIKERISHYVPYFNSIKESSNSLALSMQEISKTEIKLN